MSTSLPWKPRVIPSFAILFVMVYFWTRPISVSGRVHYIPNEELVASSRIVYTFVTDHLPWNRAQEACRLQFGGTLATVDSNTVHARIEHLEEGAWSNGFGNAWVGLHWDSDKTKRWSDRLCQRYVDYGLPFKNPDDRNWNEYRKCYQLETGSVVSSFERKECNTNLNFICQHFEPYPNASTYERFNLKLKAVASDSVLLASNVSSDCNSTCDQVTGCFLNSRLGGTTCILGIIDPDADTYSKEITYRGTIGTIGNSVMSQVVTNVPNDYPNTPRICVVKNALPSFINNTFVDPSAIQTVSFSECVNITTTETVTSNIETTVTSTIETTVASTIETTVASTIEMTVTSTIVTTIHYTTTEIQTSFHPVIQTTVNDVIQTTTELIPTTVYITKTVTNSLESLTEPSTTEIVDSSSTLDSFKLNPTMTNSLDSSSPKIEISRSTQSASLTTSTNPSTVPTPNINQLKKNIVSDLKIDSRSTSKALARLNSAGDSRKSAQAIGILGVGILTLICGIILITDLPHFIFVARIQLNILKDIIRRKIGTRTETI